MAIAAGISVGPGLTLIRLDHLYQSFRHLGFGPLAFDRFTQDCLGLTYLYPPGRHRPFIILQDFMFALRIALMPGKQHLLAPGAHYNGKSYAKERCRRCVDREEFVTDLEEALTLMLFNSRIAGARLTTAARSAMREVAERMATGPMATLEIQNALAKSRPVVNVSKGPYDYDATIGDPPRASQPETRR